MLFLQRTSAQRVPVFCGQEDELCRACRGCQEEYAVFQLFAAWSRRGKVYERILFDVQAETSHASSRELWPKVERCRCRPERVATSFREHTIHTLPTTEDTKPNPSHTHSIYTKPYTDTSLAKLTTTKLTARHRPHSSVQPVVVPCSKSYGGGSRSVAVHGCCTDL